MPQYLDLHLNTSPTVYRQRVLRRRGIVIHTTEGTSSLAWLQGGSAVAGRPASADFLINRRGDIMQLIAPGYYSFHSGQARHGLYQEPDRSINQGYYGIELEQSLALGQKVTNLQYIGLAFITRVLVTIGDFDLRNIVGHYQVALPQGRKQDPTGFDWGIFTTEVINPSIEWRDHKFESELP